MPGPQLRQAIPFTKKIKDEFPEIITIWGGYFASNQYKVCLEYHIGNCLGGCEGHQKEEDYDVYISNIRDFLKGNLSSSLNYFKNEMKTASDCLQFEKAQSAKEKIELLENYQSKSTVVSSKLNNIDVFSIISDSSHAYVNHLQVAFGRIVRFHNVEIKKKLEETDRKLLLMTLVNLRDKFNSKRDLRRHIEEIHGHEICHRYIQNKCTVRRCLFSHIMPNAPNVDRISQGRVAPVPTQADFHSLPTAGPVVWSQAVAQGPKAPVMSNLSAEAQNKNKTLEAQVLQTLIQMVPQITQQLAVALRMGMTTN